MRDSKWPLEGVTGHGIPYKAWDFEPQWGGDTSLRASVVFCIRQWLGLKTDLDE